MRRGHIYKRDKSKIERFFYTYPRDIFFLSDTVYSALMKFRQATLTKTEERKKKNSPGEQRTSTSSLIFTKLA